MKLYKKILVSLLTVALLLPGAAPAQQEPSPYPLQYWVIGTLQLPPDNPPVGFTLANYKVVLYKDSGDPSTGFAYGLTDALGQFSINPFDDNRLDPKPGVDYYLGVIAKTGFGVSESTIKLDPQGYTEKTLKLAAGAGIGDPEGATLVVTVQHLDNQGAGVITNATVWVEKTGLSTKLNANGSYTLKSVPLGPQSIAASAPGYVATSAAQEIVAGNNALTLTLLPAQGTFKGTVTDIGDPSKLIDNPSVTIGDVSVPLAGPKITFDYAVDIGVYPVIAKATNYDTRTYAGVEIKQDLITNLDIYLISNTNPQNGSLAGKVVYENGASVEGVVVSIPGKDSNMTAQDIGDYYIPDIPAGTYPVKAIKDVNGTYVSVLFDAVVIEAGKTTTLNITWPTTPPNPGKAIIKGVVSSATTGQLLSGALVSIKSAATEQLKTSDQAGAYQSDPLDPGAYTLACSLKDYEGSSALVTPEANQFYIHNIALTPAKPIPLKILTSSLPDGTETVLYPATNLLAEGGVGAYNWSTDATTPLPAGLNLDPQSGVISGTPASATAFTYPIKFTVSDGSTTASATIPLTIYTYGVVPLTIERVDNDIKISWDSTKYQDLVGYLLIEDQAQPVGQFINAYNADKWKVIGPDNLGIMGEFDVSHSTNTPVAYVLHENMVGTQSKRREAYYKAFINGVDIQAKFALAPAVGKMDYTFGTGNNYFNYPFINTSTDVASLFGTSGYPNSSQVLKHDRTTDGFIGTTFDLGSWSNSFALEQGRGYVFFNNGAPLKTTLVGQVDPNPAAFSLDVLTGNNYIGLPFPITQQVVKAFGDKPGMNDNFLAHDRSTDGFIGNSFNGTVFENPTAVQSAEVGYVYFRNTGGFKWQPQP